MRILGLDPGSRYTGYGVVDRLGSRLLAIDYGRIVCPTQAPLPERLALLARELRAIVCKHRPEAAVLEALYGGVNTRSLIILAQARGALLAVLAGEGLPVEEYSPAEVKTAVTGYGRADKEQVARMVRRILGLDQEPLPSDATDALAVALCFAQRARLDRLGARAKKLSAGASTPWTKHDAP